MDAQNAAQADKRLGEWLFLLAKNAEFNVSEFLQFIGLPLVERAPCGAYASERFTVLFAVEWRF